MKAIRLHHRGGPEQLVYEEAPKPVLQPGDALVKVLASATTRNELDWGPTYTDQQGNSRLPSIPGHELCGIVESIAPGVKDVAVGDAVYGLTSFFRDGTAAEYIATAATDLAPKPVSLDPIQAAAVPLAALTAWQAFFDHAGLLPGQKLLVHGAAGGVGTFAVQIGRWHGAKVIATADGDSLDLVRSLGAAQAIDYKTRQFDDMVGEVDVVLDTVGGETQDRSWKVLKKGGILVSIAGESIRQPDAKYGVKGIFFIVKPDRMQLIGIGSLLDQGVIKPVIAAVLPLQQARQAFEQALGHGKQGKIVLNVNA
jgi:NADPH:quinone reductase-like Zn-dependent oxidoreductase